MSKSIDEQMDVIRRGTVQIVSEDELEAKLTSGKPLRVKLGMDPTAPDVHLGHSVVLRKLRHFQDLGHQAILIVGDYTARVGDPSGQKETRPQLTPEAIDENARTYLEQVGKIVDVDRLEVVKNGQWFQGLSFDEVLQLTSRMTVARMLERDDFSVRFKEGSPIQIHEFIYCLMQGYDSVRIQADVELGGTDQTFNLLVGRDLQRAVGQDPQVCITLPLLEGLGGGAKMSKSLGNAVGVLADPDDMYGKIMSIPDTLMRSYYTLLTSLPVPKIHPRDAKGALALEVTRLYHGREAAERAAEGFVRRFRHKEDPDEIPPIEIPDGEVSLVRLIVLAGFAKSNSEARRLMTQGAVRLDDVKITDPHREVEITPGSILKVGKLRIGRITR
jgi:tyrosyl-tRNA synthetase